MCAGQNVLSRYEYPGACNFAAKQNPCPPVLDALAHQPLLSRDKDPTARLAETILLLTAKAE
jgi:hypothetical protein